MDYGVDELVCAITHKIDTDPWSVHALGRPNRLGFVSNKMTNKNSSTFPEFVLEKDFQCHNKALITDVVCKTIQNFVKQPQDVRLSVTVAFRPYSSSDVVSHEQEATATIQVDKPGDFYPGGNDQRIRDRQLKILKELEKAKRNERKEQIKERIDREDQQKKRPKGQRKDDLGVKRSSNGTTGCLTQVPPSPSFKAEPRKLPTGEMYAVREVGQHRPSKVPSTSEKKWNLNMTRKPSSEEMAAIRENGDRRDDSTERDEPSIEIVDIGSDMSTTAKPKKSTKFVGLPSESQSPTKVATTSRGLAKLEDDGVSSKVLACIVVEK
ncbi:unnamed protein product [Angiostrongylus costaricensis]|uniref:IMS_C domain-containing protein n=1 Tax=Angiostrongylus costaricensis TaxID=334426 RepID=A0A158PMI6_ANGCS|nr:unnamed protein product [Angiostrongylus costaricensis]